MREHKAGAVMVFLNPLFQTHKKLIADLCAQYRLPAMTADPLYVSASA